MRKKLSLTLVSVLFLLGSGCATRPPADTSDATSSAASVGDLSAAAGLAETAPVRLAAATTDASWDTYVGKALGISFDWPTKGRYAPRWEVSAADLTDAKIADGCWDAEKGTIKRKVAAGDAVFCHSSSSSQDGDTTVFADRYVTKGKSSYIVIGFTKIGYPITDKKCAASAGTALSTLKDACSPLVVSDYRSALDGIVGTFRFGAK